MADSQILTPRLKRMKVLDAAPPMQRTKNKKCYFPEESSTASMFLTISLLYSATSLNSLLQFSVTNWNTSSSFSPQPAESALKVLQVSVMLKFQPVKVLKNEIGRKLHLHNLSLGRCL